MKLYSVLTTKSTSASTANPQCTSLCSSRTLAVPPHPPVLPILQNTGLPGSKTRGATLLGKWLKPKTVKSSYSYGVCPTSADPHAVHSATLPTPPYYPAITLQSELWQHHMLSASAMGYHLRPWVIGISWYIHSIGLGGHLHMYRPPHQICRYVVASANM
jgi:hypothetical protein